MLTEAQACQRWCPMARVRGGECADGAGCNRREYGPLWAASACIASDCMMWRWADGQPLSGYGLPIPADEFTGLEHEQERRGYCGLAGKPEFRT